MFRINYVLLKCNLAVTNRKHSSEYEIDVSIIRANSYLSYVRFLLLLKNYKEIMSDNFSK